MTTKKIKKKKGKDNQNKCKKRGVKIYAEKKNGEENKYDERYNTRTRPTEKKKKTKQNKHR